MSYFSTVTNDQLYAFRQIVVTKILFYPGRGKHRNSRQQKWSKTQSLSRAQLPSKPCYSIENWETIHPRVPSIFRCQNKAWDVYARKLLQLQSPARDRHRDEAHAASAYRVIFRPRNSRCAHVQPP